MTTYRNQKHHVPEVTYSVLKLISINYIVCIDYEAQEIVVIQFMVFDVQALNGNAPRAEK